MPPLFSPLFAIISPSIFIKVTKKPPKEAR